MDTEPTRTTGAERGELPGALGTGPGDTQVYQRPEAKRRTMGVAAGVGIAIVILAAVALILALTL